MRIAMTEDEFDDQLQSAKTEAMKAFGDEVMLLEKFVENPRYVNAFSILSNLVYNLKQYIFCFRF